MVDQSMVGATGAPFVMSVEQGKVREFAAAIRATAPEYQLPDAPIPPTFLMTYGFWATTENMAWGDDPPAFEGLLHGEQEFTFLGLPPAAGDRLTCQMRIDRVYHRVSRTGRAMRFIDTVIEFRDHATDEPRVESRASLIQTLHSDGNS